MTGEVQTHLDTEVREPDGGSVGRVLGLRPSAQERGGRKRPGRSGLSVAGVGKDSRRSRAGTSASAIDDVSANEVEWWQLQRWKVPEQPCSSPSGS